MKIIFCSLGVVFGGGLSVAAASDCSLWWGLIYFIFLVACIIDVFGYLVCAKARYVCISAIPVYSLYLKIYKVCIPIFVFKAGAKTLSQSINKKDFTRKIAPCTSTMGGDA
jgi:hypothetical protein